MSQSTVDMFTYLFIGMALGVLLYGFLQSGGLFGTATAPLDAHMDRPAAAPGDDGQILDYLEAAEKSLFFNGYAGDAGMWGLLDEDNKIIAVGLTIRGTVRRARDVELQKLSMEASPPAALDEMAVHP